MTIQDNIGYNLLQKSVGLNHIELVKWILGRPHTDVNRFPCSLPLHIACLKGKDVETNFLIKNLLWFLFFKGHIECVELLLKHGARLDTEARMCFPGLHSHNCEEVGKNKGEQDSVDRPPTKLQNCVSYAIDGDQINVLNVLSQKMEEPWGVLFRGRKPLLHLACERGAWKCVEQLVTLRSDEINLMKDEFYPIHQVLIITLLVYRIINNIITNSPGCASRWTISRFVDST